MVSRRGSAEALAARLPALLVEAQRIAETVALGEHGRRRVGRGDAFWQFRPYDPGDPATRIDWRRSARGDRVFVRETEWEAAQTAYLWRDASPSMNWSSVAGGPTKQDRAELLLVALAALLLRGSERVALLGDAAKPISGRSGLERIARAVVSPSASDGLPPATPLQRHATAVLIGDFLGDLPALSERVGQLSSNGTGGQLVQVLDPAETDLPYDGRVRFEGLEGEAAALVPRVETLREAYREALAERRAQLARIAQAAGWGLILHSTAEPAVTPLVALHRALAPGRRALA